MVEHPHYIHESFMFLFQLCKHTGFLQISKAPVVTQYLLIVTNMILIKISLYSWAKEILLKLPGKSYTVYNDCC